MIRLLPNGAIDTSLGGEQGLSLDQFSRLRATVNSTTQQYTFVRTFGAAGTGYLQEIQLQRMNDDGSVDLNYGVNGLVDIEPPIQAYPSNLWATLF